MSPRRIRTLNQCAGLTLLCVAVQTGSSVTTSPCLAQDQTTPRAAAVDPKGPSQVVLFLVDNSGSRNNQAVTPAWFAAIAHYCSVADLAPLPIAVGAFVFNSDQERITLVGDAEGKLTTNKRAFLRELAKADRPPAGVSPIDMVLERTLLLINELPKDIDITVVFLSDGQPRHDRVRPDLYPDVAARRTQIQDRLRANGASEDFVSAQMRLVDQGRGPDGKALFELQDRQQFQRCKELAQALAHRQVRFVSVPDRDYVPLRELHQAAGGADDDRLVTPPDRLIQAFDELKLTQFPLVFRDRKEEKPSGNLVKGTVELDHMTRSALVTLAFSQPVSGWDANVAFMAALGGKVIEVRQAEADESAQVLTDSAGKAVGVVVRFDGVTPENRTLTIDFSTPNGATAMPNVTVYIDMKVRDDIVPVFRPTNTHAAKKDPPYQVEADAPLQYEFYFVDKNEQRVAIAGADALAVHKHAHQESALPLAANEDEQWLFESDLVPLAEGVYDVLITVETLEGRSFTLPLPHHIVALRQLISITVTPSQDPADSAPRMWTVQKRTLHLGTVGDAHERLEHTLLLGLKGADQAVALEVRCVNVIDSAGNPINQTLVRPARSELQLVPGKLAKLRLLCELPDVLDPSLHDGLVSFDLQFVRKDLDIALPAELGDYQSQIDDVTRVVFVLKRPRVLIRTRQVDTAALDPWKAARPASHLVLPVEIPKEITVPVWIRTDSATQRSVQLPATITLQDTKIGSAITGLTMSRSSPEEASVELGPGQSVRAVYVITIPNGLASPFEGTLQVTGPRLLRGEVLFRGPLPAALLGPRSRSFLTAAALLAILLASFAAFMMLRLRNAQPGQHVLISRDRPNVAGLSATRGTLRKVVLESDPDFSYEMKSGLRAPWTPLRGRILLDPEAIQSGKVLIARVDDAADDERPHHDLELQLLRLFDLPRHDLEVEAAIRTAIPFEERWKRTRMELVVCILAALTFLGVMLWLRTSSGIDALQSLSDRWPGLQAFADRWPL